MTSFDESENTNQQNTTQKISNELKSKTQEASTAVKQEASKKLDENREKAASEIETLAHAARVAASDLKEQNHEGLSHYIIDMADQVTALAGGLRNKSIDDLMQEAQKIARNNPALFIAGGIAIGLGIARFAKASSHRSDQHADYRNAEVRPSELNNENDAFSSDFAGDYPTHSGSEFGAQSGTDRDSFMESAGTMGNGLSKQNGNGASTTASTTGGNRYE